MCLLAWLFCVKFYQNLGLNLKAFSENLTYNYFYKAEKENQVPGQLYGVDAFHGSLSVPVL